ncbi:MAG: recombinase family protein, partial [Thermosynechococcaceae cyanobacterium]
LKGQGNLVSTTPLAFFETEVLLFWPLALQHLHLRGYFPYRLRPETEQALALKQWGEEPIAPLQAFEALTADQWTRRILDLVQLAAVSGTPLTQLADRLQSETSMPTLPPSLANLVQHLALQWQDWCLGRGLLTYGLIADLFWRCLLPHETYRTQIPQRFRAIAADDVDNYPAILRSFFELTLDLELPAVFTYTPFGGIRTGLGADPQHLLGLRDRCTELVVSTLSGQTEPEVASVAEMAERLQQAIQANQPAFYAIQTVSRIQLLQQVAQEAIRAIRAGEVQPQDIAIIGPGLDPLARYTLMETLQQAGLAVESLRDQRPLQSAAIVRALLTLLALVYPGLGHLIAPEQVAELLVVFSTSSSIPSEGQSHGIDPVRAGLLADYCFRPHPEHPELLPIETYGRWDRLGHRAAHAYETLRNWIAQQQRTLSPNLPTGSIGSGDCPATPVTEVGATLMAPSAYLALSPVFILDRAIQTFLTHRPLPLDHLSILRELIETAQHYWEVDGRLRKIEPSWPSVPETVEAFIQLLRRGVISANPYPTTLGLQPRRAIVLATTFQYLNVRLRHPWQFWLDAGSQLWQYGGGVELWGAALFLQQNSPLKPLSQVEMSRMAATVMELIGRTQDRVYLCHSDLAVNGQAQLGPLLPWVEMATPWLPDLDTP